MGGDEGASPAEEGQGRGAHRAQDYGGGTAQGTRRAPGMVLVSEGTESGRVPASEGFLGAGSGGCEEQGGGRRRWCWMGDGAQHHLPFMCPQRTGPAVPTWAWVYHA